MGRHCSICDHPERDKLESALVSGATLRDLAQTFGVSRDAVRRHRIGHLSPALVAMQAEREHDGTATLLDRVESLITRTERLLSAAEKSGAVTTALAAVREQRELLRLLGAASGELNDRPQVTINLMASEEYIAVRSAILAALMAYPEARQAVSGRLLALEAGSGA